MKYPTIEQQIYEMNQLNDKYDKKISNNMDRFRIILSIQRIQLLSEEMSEERILYNKIERMLKNYNRNITYSSLFKYINSPNELLNELKGSYSTQFVPGNTWNEYSSTSGVIEYERGGYATHDVDFTYKPNSMKNTTFNFGVGNIFDKKYVSHNGFGSQITSTHSNYDARRNVNLQLSYRF